MREYLPGDIICTRGSGILARAIRFFSRGWGESRTQVNHVGIVVTAGPAILSPRGATVVEAMRKVIWRPLAEHKSPIIIFRPIVDNVVWSRDDIDTSAEKALAYVGRTYGYAKIITHALDWFLGGAYVFRRLTNSDRYPICSWLVAHACDHYVSFGVESGQAQPDDIYDFCMENHELFDIIHELEPLR